MPRCSNAAFALITLILAACAADPSGSQIDPPELAATATSTIDATQPTEEAVRTSTTEALTLIATSVPTPRFDALQIGNDVLSFNSASVCQLPCWNNLRPGVSTVEEVQQTVQNVLGFDKSVNVWSQAAQNNDYPGMVIWDNTWLLNSDIISPESFRIVFFLNQNTRALEATLIEVSGEQFRPDTSPEQILEQNGSPSEMFIELQLTEDSQVISSSLVMLDERGVTVSYFGLTLPAHETEEGLLAVAFCLESMATPLYDARIMLSKPLSEQQLSSYICSDANIPCFYESFTDVFGMPLSTVVELAVEQEDACLLGQVP